MSTGNKFEETNPPLKIALNFLKMSSSVSDVANSHDHFRLLGVYLRQVIFISVMDSNHTFPLFDIWWCTFRLGPGLSSIFVGM